MLRTEVVEDLVEVAVVDLKDGEAVLASDGAEIVLGVVEVVVEELPDRVEVVARFRQVRVLQLHPEDRVEQIRMVSLEVLDQARRRSDGLA